MIRVLVADDHPVMRNGLAAVLGSLGDIDVVAVAADGREAVREVVLRKPDVALIDLQMPNLDGFGALREISRLAPRTAVCVLTMFDDDDSLFAAMRAGARGYLLKGAEQEDIARAVRAMHAGEAVFGPRVAQRILQQLTSPPLPARGFPELTDREYQVLDLLAAGLATHAIALRLDIAPKTVSNLVSNLLSKLRLADRIQAAVVARDAGLGRPTPP
ncbi:MAG: response regulator transcription factor [Actinomycetota bacterium]|nr:response regulator transcription factor [Actinomycetota bacterium]